MKVLENVIIYLFFVFHPSRLVKICREYIECSEAIEKMKKELAEFNAEIRKEV